MRRAFASVVVLVVAAVLSGGVGDGAIGSGAVGAGAVGNGAVGSPQRGEEGDAITALAPLLDYDAASLALSNNDPVSSWPNSGSLGSDWDLANTGASTTKPTFVTNALGSASAVNFDGGDFIGVASASPSFDAPLTVGVVTAVNATAGRVFWRTIRLDGATNRVVDQYVNFDDDPSATQTRFQGGVGGAVTQTLPYVPSVGTFFSWSASVSGVFGASGETDGDVNAAGLSPSTTGGPGSVESVVSAALGSSSPTSASGGADLRIVRAVVLSGEKVDELEAAFAATYGSFPQ